jgi:hypothetical protein
MRGLAGVVVTVAVLGALSVGACTQGDLTVPYTFDDGTQGSVRCEYTDSTLLPGMLRVDIALGPASVDVNAAEFFYVRHGFGGEPPECRAAWGWADFDLPALTAFLLASFRFELRINGTAVAPDYIRIDPADGKVAWYFEFPANSFAPGVYLFEGHWVRTLLDVSGCLEVFEPEDLIDGTLYVGLDHVKSCLVSIYNY